MNALIRLATMAALVATGGSAMAEDKAPIPIDNVSWGALGPWASSSSSVSIDSEGRVAKAAYQKLPPPPPCPVPGPGEAAKCAPKRQGVTTTRFSVGPAGYAEIRAILAPLERKATKPRGKTCEISDAGYAGIGWRTRGKETSYALGISCEQRDNQWADSLADAAARKLTELESKATDRTEVVE